MPRTPNLGRLRVRPGGDRPGWHDKTMTANQATAQDEVVDICRDLIRIDTSNPGDHSGPGERQAAERVAALLAPPPKRGLLLVALAVEGLGSCWVSSTMFCRDVTRAALALPADWDPMGAVGVGHAARQVPDRPPRNPDEYLITR